MKLLILLALVAGGGALGVASLVFKSPRATKLLKQLRLAAWAYVAMIIAVAAYRVWQQGGL